MYGTGYVAYRKPSILIKMIQYYVSNNSIISDICRHHNLRRSSPSIPMAIEKDTLSTSTFVLKLSYCLQQLEREGESFSWNYQDLGFH